MRFDDSGEFELTGRKGSSRPGDGFDPLTHPWPEVPAPAGASGDDWLQSFEAAPAETEEFSFHSPAPRIATYPDRRDSEFEERMTEWQRRLREGTVVVPKPERRWVVTLRELAETLLLAALIFLAVRASFQNFRVEGASMQPSLQDGEYLIVNKLSYAEFDLGALDWLPFVEDDGARHLWDEPSRGDVIVFRAPTSTTRDFIKRVIGLPGDKVEIYRGTGEVYVNGQLLEESSYIQGATSCSSDTQCVFDIPTAGSPEAQAECGADECYFVLGDNRQNSSDSRQGWLVPRENIIGKALITYWHEGSPKIALAPNHSVGLADEAEASADEAEATETPPVE